MISLETARKLKEAGLKWERQIGDFLWSQYTSSNRGVLLIREDENEEYPGDTIQTWLPRLDQMLAEIEKLGYEWELGILTLNDGRTYMIDVALEELIKTESEEWKSFVANSPEEATAQVLLWILEQEVTP